MICLITGANGFLGARVARQFAERGAQVISAGRPAHDIPSVEFAALVNASPPNVVVHCATPASVPASMKAPLADLTGSIGVLASVLDLVRRLQTPPRVLFLSSAAVYGQPEKLPIAEDAPLKPLSPYGYHRRMCELLLTEAYSVYGVPTATMRVFSAYGEGLRRQIIWDICRKGIEHGVVELAGTGRESRDFIHAQDVADAAWAIIREGSFEAESYNVGSGIQTFIDELARIVLDALGMSRELISFSGSPRAGDPNRWQADIGKLTSLGFRPAVALIPGVSAYAAWATSALKSATQAYHRPSGPKEWTN